MTTRLWFAIFICAVTTLSIMLIICRRQYTQHVTDLRALWTKSVTEARTLRMENDALHDSLRYARAALLVEESEHKHSRAVAAGIAMEARPEMRGVYEVAAALYGTERADEELVRSWEPR